MADQTEAQYLTATSKNGIARDIDRNDQSLNHVRSVCAILKDAFDREVDTIQDYLQELLTPDILFDTECQINNRVYFIMRRLLQDLGIFQAHDRSSRRISIKVARALYTDTNDPEEAEVRIKAYLQSKQTRPTQASDTARHASTGHHHSANETNTLSRNKAAVAPSFKEEDKFTGSVSGKVPLHRVQNLFLDTVRDQAIPRADEVTLIHRCLSGMALDFYYKHIRDTLTTKEEAFSVLEKRFNSLQHQAQARMYLNSMDINSIKKEKSCSTLEALEIAHNRVNDTVPNCVRDYQQESYYCDFLERMVQQQRWAHPVIQDRLTPSSDQVMDYNTSYSKLVAALTTWDTMNSTNDDERHAAEGYNLTFFGERYATPHFPRNKGNSSRSHNSHSRQSDIRSMIREPNRMFPGMSASKLAQLKARTKCLLCKQYGHWRQECPERNKRRTRDAMLSMVRHYGNDSDAVAKALWTVSEDNDEYFAYMENKAELSLEAQTIDPNPLEADINSDETTTTYGDEDASADLQHCFDDMAEHFVSYSNMEEEERLAGPTRI